MRRTASVCFIVALVSCAKSENKPDTTAAAAAKAMPATPAFALADVAGKWNVVSKNEAGDSTLATYTMTATADTAGWTVALPNRPVMPARVSVMGDSVSVDMGPYESVLRKGVKVKTHTIFHLNAGKLTGMTVAHYAVKTADSVRNIRSEATRVP